MYRLCVESNSCASNNKYGCMPLSLGNVSTEWKLLECKLLQKCITVYNCVILYYNFIFFFQVDLNMSRK